ncbi:hypothetical protein Y032_0188g1155 [Ancylostoma ceylanicum]|uniref:Cytosol aminopeptidase domain-containing protein n=1 Tax=Ancylostoma ceylanicum TaxID=53326 RepID=A0A016SRL1_9BILA|nr:hypothetical protein Y032_0188g1155 [Ancylostoma ceylanicum]
MFSIGVRYLTSMSLQSLLSTRLLRAASLNDSAYDGVILVTNCAKLVAETPALKGISSAVQDFIEVHHGALTSSNIVPVDKKIIPSGRLILAGTGPVTRDFDDVRRFQTAARNGVKLALSAGIKAPLLVTVPHPRYPQAELVSALGALIPLYTPLNVREEEPVNKFEQLGLLPIHSERLVDYVEAYEAAFTVCRDVGETGPERMSPPNTAEYVKSAFVGGKVKVEVTDDQKVIEKEYPLMAAVNRCANTVKEHQARLVRLEYVGEGDIKDTYMMVGKGVTIDTGGCDLKTGGHMWGMCRDKYGSAVVAGFFKALEILKPKNIKAVGYMCMVRNSIGARSYTCDEVIKSRSGKRIHIYNTDAEGRITMLDPLTRAKEEALKEKNPHLMTLATLTGHEVLTYGYYAAIMDNGPAKKSGWARKIQDTGDAYGQPIEISRLHPEDFEFHKAECEQAHIRQGNTKPSVATLRGHQTPAAFLMMASRLVEHGCDSEHPLKFTHIDIGSAAGDHPETSLPNPLVTLVAESVSLSPY